MGTTMIIDSHVWPSKPEHWGGKGVMDDAMCAAGWAARGLGAKTGLLQGMSAEQMIERMDEAGVDMAVCHADVTVRFAGLKLVVVHAGEDVSFVKSLPAQASGHNIAPSLPDLTEDDIADYLGNNSARLFGIVTP